MSVDKPKCTAHMGIMTSDTLRCCLCDVDVKQCPCWNDDEGEAKAHCRLCNGTGWVKK